MELTSKQISHLRGLAHHLNPAATVGKNGLSTAMIAELGRNLDDHELIKVRIEMEDRDEKAQLAQEAADKTGAALVQLVGHIVVLYRKSAKLEGGDGIKLP